MRWKTFLFPNISGTTDVEVWKWISHTLLSIYVLIHAGIKINSCWLKEHQMVLIKTFIWHFVFRLWVANLLVSQTFCCRLTPQKQARYQDIGVNDTKSGARRNVFQGTCGKISKVHRDHVYTQNQKCCHFDEKSLYLLHSKLQCNIQCRHWQRFRPNGISVGVLQG